jgi:glycosyltransferase involved in cell wall biosynthesis
VLCTFNRAAVLARALEALVNQAEGTPLYEVLVIDNNSRDRTRQVVAPFLRGGVVRYLHEPEQGLSAARNCGIRHARAPIVAFTDDDVLVDRSWLRTIACAFARQPEIAFLGGKVLPIWFETPPRWLAFAGNAPLALADYGDEPRLIDPQRPICLLGANLCVHRAAFDHIGMFSTQLQRLRDGIGSTEDHELQLRLLGAGFTGLYDPALVVRAPVPGQRLRRRYHRAWHLGHGRYFALMREPGFERTRWAPLGVPGHVYRAAVREAVAWTRDLLRLRGAAAFAHELRLRFLVGFARQRILDRRHG